jgi:hypothetical protein
MRGGILAFAAGSDEGKGSGHAGSLAESLDNWTIVRYAAEHHKWTVVHLLKENIVNVALWIVQLVLAAAFVFAGVMKLSVSVDKLAKRMTWVNGTAVAGVRFIGLAELLGGIGLLLPAITGVDAWLTPLAAACLAFVMLLAAVFHLARREISQTPPSVVLGVLAAFAAYGRFVVAPF